MYSILSCIVCRHFPVMCMVGYLGQVEPVCCVRLIPTHCCIHFVFVFFKILFCVLLRWPRENVFTGGRRKKSAKVVAPDLFLFRDSHGRF